MFAHNKMVCWILIAAALSGGCGLQPAKNPTPQSLEVLECIEGWGCVRDAANTPPPGPTGTGQRPTSLPSHPKISAGTVRPRQASWTQLQGDVRVQNTPDGAYLPAQAGAAIPVGSSIRTGSSGFATLTFQPDGTLMRVGSNALLAIKSLTLGTDGRPETHIVLDRGQLWVLPQGGQIAVKTNVATASTDNGSPLGVSYDPASATLRASCLQGICSLRNEQGTVILTSGMMAIVSGGELPYSSQQMDGQDLQEWVDENPGLPTYFGGQVPSWLPTPDR